MKEEEDEREEKKEKEWVPLTVFNINQFWFLFVTNVEFYLVCTDFNET